MKKKITRIVIIALMTMLSCQITMAKGVSYKYIDGLGYPIVYLPLSKLSDEEQELAINYMTVIYDHVTINDNGLFVNSAKASDFQKAGLDRSYYVFAKKDLRRSNRGNTSLLKMKFTNGKISPEKLAGLWEEKRRAFKEDPSEEFRTREEAFNVLHKDKVEFMEKSRKTIWPFKIQKK